MQTIYKITDTYTGNATWSLKKGLPEAHNILEAALKVKRLADMGLELGSATLDDVQYMNDFASDHIKYETFQDETTLIKFLNV